jgi:hypothetical protein
VGTYNPKKRPKKKKKDVGGGDAELAASASVDDVDVSLFAGLTTADSRPGASAGAAARAIPRLTSADGDDDLAVRAPAPVRARAEPRPGTPIIAVAPTAATRPAPAPAPAPGAELQALEDLFHGMNVYPAAAAAVPAAASSTQASLVDLLGPDVAPARPAPGAAPSPKLQISASAILSLYGTGPAAAAPAGYVGCGQSLVKGRGPRALTKVRVHTPGGRTAARPGVVIAPGAVARPTLGP